MDITITINCDNAAFDESNCGPELARILSRLAGTIQDMDITYLEAWAGISPALTLKDFNGNTVGKVEITE